MQGRAGLWRMSVECKLELKMKVKQRFADVSIVSYSCPSLVIIASRTQFHVERPWGQPPFSIVSIVS